MNWYIKKIFAQTSSLGLENYLSTLGATPDVVQYILSLDKKSAQILTNEIRKNPSITLEELKESQNLQTSEKKDPYTASEKRLAANFELEAPQFSKWILVNSRKLRRGLLWTDNMGNQIAPYGSPLMIGNQNSKKSPLTEHEIIAYQTFHEKIPEIVDWYSRINPDIFSYSPQTAIEASDEWHRMMAGQGEGKSYEPTKSANIVYGPTWKDPNKNGWTIQKVVSENDLLAEGKKMNHCVGGYCDQVKEGKTNIYSLRDPQNNPHVTIEVDSSDGHIEQIQGNSNQEPNDNYKEFVKEWITSSGKDSGIDTKVLSFADLDEKTAYGNISIDDISNTISKILMGENNEYGLKYVFDSDMDTVLNELVETAEATSRRDQSYSGEITNIPTSIVNLAIKEDLELPHWPRHSQEHKEMIVNNPKQTKWNNISEIETWAWEEIDKITENFYQLDTGLEYPNEEDYETQQDFDKEFARFEEAESEIHDEWIKESLRGGFSKDLLNEINYNVKRGIIPSAQERFDLKEKEKEKEKANNPVYQNSYDKGREMVMERMEQV